MKLDVEVEDGITVVRPRGKLDAMSSPDFQDAINEVLDGGVQQLIVDLTDVPFVSSAGLRVFVVIAKKLKGSGKLVVTGLSENVHEVFSLAGFDRLMCLSANLETAKSEF